MIPVSLILMVMCVGLAGDINITAYFLHNSPCLMLKYIGPTNECRMVGMLDLTVN